MDTHPNAPTVRSVWRHSNGQTYQVVGSVRRHRNGQSYQVATVTNIGSTKLEHPETVVYIITVHDTWWSLSISDWHRIFTRVDSDAVMGE
jgi:hypothetical protein